MRWWASRARGFWIVAAGSFGVYLLPLVGPHGFRLLGDALLVEWTAAGSHRDPAWIAADLALALALQTTTALVLAWCLRGGRHRILVWPVLVPLLFVVLQYAYLAAIPARFLIERDTAVERQDWAEQCVVQDASLMSVHTPVSLAAQDVREWWLQRSDGSYALLRVPACTVSEARLPQPAAEPGGRVPFVLSVTFAIAGGTAMVERMDPPSARRSWWLLREPGAPLDRLSVPDRQEAAPILSNRGDAVAWLEAVPGSGPPLLQRVRIRRVGSDQALDETVDLTPWGPAGYVLLEIDTTAHTLTVWRNDRLLMVGFDGALHSRSAPTEAIRAQATTYVRSRDGWLAWDAYQDEAAYHISWSTPSGSGEHRVSKGRAITSAAFDSSGRFIAISATTTLSIGRARDVVYVLRASDHGEVFRRYLPRYTRSAVVFFGGGLFGYSGEGRTHVLRLPD